MSDITELIVYRLNPTKKQAGVLRRTLRQFTMACEEAAAYADRKATYNSRTLSALLSGQLRKKYGLPSGVAECVVRRVSQDFTALNPDIKRGERRPNIPNYTDNSYFLCSKDTASILIHPAGHPAVWDYPLCVSLSVLKERLRVPVREREIAHTAEGQRWHNREMRLYSYRQGEEWNLEVALADTEGEITDFNPDHEEPDWVPDEGITE